MGRLRRAHPTFEVRSNYLRELMDLVRDAVSCGLDSVLGDGSIGAVGALILCDEEGSIA